MAKLWIREYQKVPQIGLANPAVAFAVAGEGSPMAQEPGVDQTPVTFTTSVASAPFAATTRYIVVVADADFHYVVAEIPTATTDGLPIPAMTPWAIGVTAGHKIAAILRA